MLDNNLKDTVTLTQWQPISVFLRCLTSPGLVTLARLTSGTRVAHEWHSLHPARHSKQSPTGLYPTTLLIGLLGLDTANKISGLYDLVKSERYTLSDPRVSVT